ncbi:MAG: hypothetical protein VW405_02070 [Rhodospirillaceae bacterium]
MKLKELAAVIMSLAALVSSVTGLVTALRAKQQIRQVDERLYQQTAEAVGENAERIAALEAGKDRR